MLGKLIKNEFKSTAHRVAWIYMVGGVTLLMLLLGYATDKVWLGALASLVLMIVGFIVLIVTFVAIATQYNRSMFGAEGYLTFTLPVSSNQLLASKVIVSSVWVLLSYAVLIGTLVISIIYAQHQINEDAKIAIQMFLEVAGAPSAQSMIEMAIFFIVDMFIGIFFLVSTVYFSFTLANTRIFQQHSTFTAICFALILLFAGAVLSYLATIYMPVIMYVKDGHMALSFAKSMANSKGLGIGGLFVNLILAISLLSGTKYLIGTKTNIK